VARLAVALTGVVLVLHAARAFAADERCTPEAPEAPTPADPKLANITAAIGAGPILQTGGSFPTPFLAGLEALAGLRGPDIEVYFGGSYLGTIQPIKIYGADLKGQKAGFFVQVCPRWGNNWAVCGGYEQFWLFWNDRPDPSYLSQNMDVGLHIGPSYEWAVSRNVYFRASLLGHVSFFPINWWRVNLQKDRVLTMNLPNLSASAAIEVFFESPFPTAQRDIAKRLGR
jgi:hypothetical protein